MSGVSLIVLAKAPVAGRSKTRLTPPCTPEQAAGLAEAALADTLAAVAATPAPRYVLALDGLAGDWLPEAFEVLPQRSGGLGRRLAGAFADVGGPALLVGMDTPQLEPGLLASSAELLMAPGTDAVIGAASDGGYWAIGLRRPRGGEFDGVPMSLPTTGAHQRRRLAELGLRCAELPPLRDVDTFDDALAVAGEGPPGRFAGQVAACRADLAPIPNI